MDKLIMDEWKELGFYYDIDTRESVNQWRFFGSKEGLQSLVLLIESYTNYSDNDTLYEHEHYGPYGSLTIKTLDKPTITLDYIAGTIQDLIFLKNLISKKLSNSLPGQTFNIDKEYGEDNTCTVKFFIMSDDFDPISMDELIISGRQKIINEKYKNSFERN